MNVSIVINTKNAGETLKRAIKSVDWADEIIVMDMASSDETREIAKKLNAKVFSHPDVGYVEPARNAAIAKASSEWILVLDADEEIPPTLQEKIVYLVEGDATADAYYIPRKNFAFGGWLHHSGWWPDYQLRLFKKHAVRWSERIHEQPKVAGTVDYLADTDDMAIVHHMYQTVEQFITQLNRYTTFEAQQRETKQIKPHALIDAFTNELCFRFFKERAIDDNLHGVGISLLQTFYEVAVLLKQWQIQSFPETPSNREKMVYSLRNLQSNLNYWIADLELQKAEGIYKIYWRLRRRFKL